MVSGRIIPKHTLAARAAGAYCVLRNTHWNLDAVNARLSIFKPPCHHKGAVHTEIHPSRNTFWRPGTTGSSSLLRLSLGLAPPRAGLSKFPAVPWPVCPELEPWSPPITSYSITYKSPTVARLAFHTHAHTPTHASPVDSRVCSLVGINRFPRPRRDSCRHHVDRARAVRSLSAAGSASPRSPRVDPMPSCAR
jgi:hypothetical protein